MSSRDGFVLRTARLDDLARLRDIERAAGALFRGVDMESVAADEPPSVESLASYVRQGRAWVAVDDDDRPVAYLIADIVDGDGHISQVSVDPGHARRRLGRALIERAAAWASAHALPSLTLTTFADVPWNRPYYERLGFHVLTDDQLGHDLRRIREDEAAQGLDRWPRVAMAAQPASVLSRGQNGTS